MKNHPGWPDFKPPDDPGEQLAWLKCLVAKLPQMAAELGVSAEVVAEVRAAYEELRAAQKLVDKARLKTVEAALSRVPDGWPPPPPLIELIRAIPAIEQPQRERMLEEIERWSAAIVRAGSPWLAPELRAGYFRRGLVVRVTLPEPCRWARIYRRPAGEAAWQWVAVTPGDYYQSTDPESQETGKKKLEGKLEFTVLGLLAHADPQVGCGEAWGAPSAVLAMSVPAEHPVPEALWDKADAPR